MSGSILYHDLTTQERETVFGYFLLRLLKKEEMWETEHKEVFVYLAALLLNLIFPTHQKAAQKYLKKTNVDLAELWDESHDTAERYHTFKFNADDSLVACGIFRPEPKNERYWITVEKGKMCYQLAARCANQIHRKETPLAAVLSHLSEQFQEYQNRLCRLRRAYLHFVKKLTREEAHYLFRQVGRLTLR